MTDISILQAAEAAVDRGATTDEIVELFAPVGLDIAPALVGPVVRRGHLYLAHSA